MEDRPPHVVTGFFACPRCGCEEMEAVSDGETMNFRCLGCAACWHVELGYIGLVDTGPPARVGEPGAR